MTLSGRSFESLCDVDRSMAIIYHMQPSEQLALADVKNRLSEVVERVESQHDRVVITKHGRASAVIISVEDLESLEETLSVLSDAKLMRDIRAASSDKRKVKLTREQALALVRR